MQLNAMYVAASSISSQLIDSNGSNQGATGKIGGVLKSVSSHIPFVGLGVQMIGAVMVQVDKNNQQEGIENYAKIVPSSTDMTTLSYAVAIELAQHAKDLTIPDEKFSGMFNQAVDIISQSVSSSETASKVVSALRKLNPTNIIDSFDVVSLAANTISGIKSRIQAVNEASKHDDNNSSIQEKTKKFAERLIFGVEQNEEEKEESEGQTKANSIAAFIIKQIFEGKISSSGSIIAEENIQNVVRSICEVFGVQNELTSVSETTESPKADVTKNTVVDYKTSQIIGVRDDPIHIQKVTELPTAEITMEAAFDVTSSKHTNISMQQIKHSAKIHPEPCDEKNIVQKILARSKFLIDAHDLVVSDATRERYFIDDLARTLRRQNWLHIVPEEDLVESITAQLYKQKIMSARGKKIIFSDKFVVDRSFFNKVIDAAKKDLPQMRIIIAQKSVARCKILLNADDLIIGNTTRKLSFIDDLANALGRQSWFHNVCEKDLVNAIAAQLFKQDIMSISGDKIFISNKFAVDNSFFDKVMSEAKQDILTQGTTIKKSYHCIVSSFTSLKYDMGNLFLYQEELLQETAKVGGIDAINCLLDLGEDELVAREIIEATKQYGVHHTVDVIFGARALIRHKIQYLEKHDV